MIIDDLLATLTSDALVQEVRVGPYWVAVCSRYCGLASTLGQAAGIDAAGLTGRSAREMPGVRLLTMQHPDKTA
jgi:hypothetical protein